MDRSHISALIVPGQPTRSAKLPRDPAEPLAPIAGKSILGWVVDAALGASVQRIAIVCDRPSQDAETELTSRADAARIEFVTPRHDIAESLAYALERLGSELTLRDSSQVLILPAEAPQIESAELRALIDMHVSRGAAATLLGGVESDSIHDAEPVVHRDETGRIASIIDRDAITPGILCINASMLVPALRRIVAPRWKNGAPLAEVAAVLDEVGHKVQLIPRSEAIASISSAATRTPIEMELRDRVIASWIERGVVMPDPRQVAIDATVTLGQGVQVLPGSVIEGVSVVGDGAVIGPNSHLVDASVGTGAHVPHSVVQGVEVLARQQVRPFSVLGAVPR